MVISKRLIAAGLTVIGASLLSQVSFFEGDGPTSVTTDGVVIHHAYPDPAHGWKVPTICQGRTRGVFKGMTVTAEQCRKWVGEELAEWVIPALERNVKVPITQQQGEALALFVDNVGETQFRSSLLLRKLNQGDCYGAAQEFGNSPQIRNGKPRLWNGRPIIDRKTGEVLLATGAPVMKWTTGAQIPLPGLILRRQFEREKFVADCDAWEQDA